jgi:hypothetical protein
MSAVNCTTGARLTDARWTSSGREPGARWRSR